MFSIRQTPLGKSFVKDVLNCMHACVQPLMGQYISTLPVIQRVSTIEGYSIKRCFTVLQGMLYRGEFNTVMLGHTLHLDQWPGMCSSSSSSSSHYHYCSSSTTCRLQLKVANSNSRIIQQFQPSDTLSAVKEYASKVCGLVMCVAMVTMLFRSFAYQQMLSYWRKVILHTSLELKMK